MKKLLFAALAVGCVATTNPAHALTSLEGFLYSAIGCTSVYKKLGEEDKTHVMLNFIHDFSNEKQITETQPGYLTRFIKMVERKWEKENDLARKNCDGIYGMALNSQTPKKYNDVAKSVIEYMWDIDSKRNKNNLPPELAAKVKAALEQQKAQE